MILKKMVVLFILGVSFTSIAAQAKFLKSGSEMKELSQKVTQLFRDSKVPEAVTIMKPYWPFPENELDGLVEKTVNNLNSVSERFGRAVGISEGKEEVIKDFAIKETYFVKYQNSAIRIIFIYFKREEGWIINSFKWDDKFYEEF